MLFCCLDSHFFFKINFSKNIFQEYHKIVSFGTVMSRRQKLPQDSRVISKCLFDIGPLSGACRPLFQPYSEFTQVALSIKRDS